MFKLPGVHAAGSGYSTTLQLLLLNLRDFSGDRGELAFRGSQFGFSSQRISCYGRSTELLFPNVWCLQYHNIC